MLSESTQLRKTPIEFCISEIGMPTLFQDTLFLSSHTKSSQQMTTSNWKKIVNSNLNNDHFVILSGLILDTDHKTYRFNGESTTFELFTNQEYYPESLTSSTINTMVLGVDRIHSTDQYIIIIDYSRLSAPQFVHQAAQQNQNDIFLLEYSIDSSDYFQTYLHSGFNYRVLLVNQDDHSPKSFLEFDAEIRYIRAFKDCRYYLLTYRTQDHKETLKFFNYYDKYNMFEIITGDVDDKFKIDNNIYQQVYMDQRGDDYELYVTNDFRRLFMYKLEHDNPEICHLSCKTCKTFNGRENGCTSCQLPRTLSEGRCICDTASFKFLEVGLECTKCSNNCKTCSGTSHQCLSCKGTFKLDPISKVCGCPALTHYLDQNQNCLKIEKNSLIFNESLQILAKFYQVYDESIKMIFSRKISIFDLKDYSIYLISNNDEQEFEHFRKESDKIKILSSKMEKNKQILTFKIKIEKNLVKNSQLQIHCDNAQSYPLSINKKSLSFSKFPIKISPIDFYKSENEGLTFKITQAISSIMKILTPITLIVSSHNFIVHAKLLQIIDFLHLMNIEVPNNLEVFLQALKGDILDFIPNPFYNDTYLSCNLHQVVQKAGFECLVANSNGQFILIFFGFFICKFFYYLIQVINSMICTKFKKKDPNSTRKTSKIESLVFWVDKKIENFLSLNTLMIIFVSLQIDIIISIMIYFQVKYYSNDWFLKDQDGKILDYISMGLSPFYIVAYTIISCGLVLKTIDILKQKYSQKKIMPNKDNIGEAGLPKKVDNKPPNKTLDENTKKDHQAEKNFEIFFQDLSTESQFGPLYILLHYSRDVLVPLLIITFTWRPKIQFYSVFSYLAIKQIILCILRPFNSRWNNYKEIIKDGTYLITLVFYLVLLEFGLDFDPTRKYYYLGYPIIFLICFLFIFNITEIIVESIQNIAQFRDKSPTGNIVKIENHEQIKKGENTFKKSNKIQMSSKKKKRKNQKAKMEKFQNNFRGSKHMAKNSSVQRFRSHISRIKFGIGDGLPSIKDRRSGRSKRQLIDSSATGRHTQRRCKFVGNSQRNLATFQLFSKK